MIFDNELSPAQLRERWERQLPGVPLVVVESPYRSLTLPFLAYLDVMAPHAPDLITIVVLPEYVPRHWWDGLLYNQNNVVSEAAPETVAGYTVLDRRAVGGSSLTFLRYDAPADDAAPASSTVPASTYRPPP